MLSGPHNDFLADLSILMNYYHGAVRTPVSPLKPLICFRCPLRSVKDTPLVDRWLTSGLGGVHYGLLDCLAGVLAVSIHAWHKKFIRSLPCSLQKLDILAKE
ncbi:hypothetical protein AVEN_118761-1 [Araneus ventricosus]|uniref:Uncharacterized protein n=1 Tax=Araneus ventricosus TaxID=182803 RepID=A0A4Y2BWS9_ARAVE|nr:hypothetical protein AVEN_118761-1 [Araneus ventricosus]